MTTAAFIAAVEVLTGPLRSPREMDLVTAASTCADISDAAKWVAEHRDDLKNGRIFISNLTGEVWLWHDARETLRHIVLEQRLRNQRFMYQGKLNAQTWNNTGIRHREQLRFEHHNSDPQFLQGVYARYCDYCLRGAPIRLAWEYAFRDARGARTHAFQKRLKTMRMQVMQEFIKLENKTK